MNGFLSVSCACVKLHLQQVEKLKKNGLRGVLQKYSITANVRWLLLALVILLLIISGKTLFKLYYTDSVKLHTQLIKMCV